MIHDDYELIQWKFPANTDIEIWPVFDVHLGAAEHMEKEWSEFCSMVLKSPNRFLICGGDLINNATRSGVSDIFAEKMRPRDQKNAIAKALAPLSDRILCMVPGNHERRSAKDADDDPMLDVARNLDIEHLYRENEAFVMIRMGDMKGDGKKNPTYCLNVTHGAGGGALTGASVNRGERIAYAIDGIDALVFGHSHKPFVTQPGKIKVDPHNNRVSLRPFKVVCATSWLSYGGYAARSMLLPSSFAPQEMRLYGSTKKLTVTM